MRIPFGRTIIVIGLAGWINAAGIIINTTASLPRGLWWTTGDKGPARPGDVVLVCPPADPQSHLYVAPGFCPGDLRPLLKPVAAVAGETVIVDGGIGLTINRVLYPQTAPLAKDEAGRPLKRVPDGTYTVPAGKVWLLSTYNKNSYDSRYFGPVDASQIIRKEKPLWTFR